ncbi:hypothetical protein C8R41DRAFT_865576 [Lentinula lateritia]|uniref:Uncharacterized protein n=1 Tax=Lentinula lateritia TaxID=40482 RepID=A0ABQ8VLI5_9AGAR|nr:hypothetical protein C8R41DRAFT_865576 [Lentinula lateritia]
MNYPPQSWVRPEIWRGASGSNAVNTTWWTTSSEHHKLLTQTRSMSPQPPSSYSLSAQDLEEYLCASGVLIVASDPQATPRIPEGWFTLGVQHLVHANIILGVLIIASDPKTLFKIGVLVIAHNSNALLKLGAIGSSKDTLPSVYDVWSMRKIFKGYSTLEVQCLVYAKIISHVLVVVHNSKDTLPSAYNVQSTGE